MTVGGRIEVAGGCKAVSRGTEFCLRVPTSFRNRAPTEEVDQGAPKDSS